jgi:transcriptional regulator with XRE-family HTH domain
MSNASDKSLSVVKQLGRRIRELRTVHGRRRMTQEDLAERADISVSFLSMIERGERTPHLETLAHLAQALEVELYELFLSAVGRAEMARVHEDLEPPARVLVEFARRRSLTRRDVDKLLRLARTVLPR